MPLLTSPIDGSPMRQIHRYGIEIDICPTSGGVWLDKGELEKIIYLLQEDMAAQNVGQNIGQSADHQYAGGIKPVKNQGRNDRHDRSRDWDDDGDDDDHRRYQKNGYYGSGKYHKKESKMSRFMDLFDF